MLSSISSSSTITSIRDYFHLVQVIYTCCLQELIRQISLDCKERALLLKKIWTAYITILENAVIEEGKTQQTREKEYLEEITKVHKIYQQEIENNYEFVEYTRNENLKLAQITKDYKENQKFLKKAYRHFEKDYKLIRTQLEITYTEQNTLLDENNRLKRLLEAQTEEKDVKSLAVDKIFQNTIVEIAQKNYEEAEVIKPSKKQKKSGKNFAKKREKSNSILEQWKNIEKTEKNVDTCDLIKTWDTTMNTDWVLGGKTMFFIEKSTQTIDRNQFVRELRISETDKGEILLTNNERKKQEKQEEKKEEKKEENFSKIESNKQINEFQSEKNFEKEENFIKEIEEDKDNMKRKIKEKSPRKKQAIMNKTVKNGIEINRNFDVSQKKIQFEISNEEKMVNNLPIKTKSKTKIMISLSEKPEKKEKSLSKEQISIEETEISEKSSDKNIKKVIKSTKYKERKSKTPISSKTAKFSANEEEPQENFEKTKDFFPAIKKPEESSSILSKTQIEISLNKLRTIHEENEEKTSRFMKKTETNSNNPESLTLIKPPNFKFIESSNNPINSYLLKSKKTLKINNKGNSADNISEKSKGNSNNNSANNSISVAEHQVYQPRHSRFVSKTEIHEEKTNSRSSSSKNHSQNNFNLNLNEFSIQIPHNKSIAIREAMFKRKSRIGGNVESTFLKRLVKADENDVQSLGLKVENNKLKKGLEDNGEALREAQEKLEKTNGVLREVKKNVKNFKVFNFFFFFLFSWKKLIFFFISLRNPLKKSLI